MSSPDLYEEDPELNPGFERAMLLEQLGDMFRAYHSLASVDIDVSCYQLALTGYEAVAEDADRVKIGVIQYLTSDAAGQPTYSYDIWEGTEGDGDGEEWYEVSADAALDQDTAAQDEHLRMLVLPHVILEDANNHGESIDPQTDTQGLEESKYVSLLCEESDLMRDFVASLWRYRQSRPSDRSIHVQPGSTAWHQFRRRAA
jgi:hypothetical protein